MPTQRHEILIDLFRTRPALVRELLRDLLKTRKMLGTGARVSCANLTEPKSAELRADLVVQLARKKPILGIVIEAQLARDGRKRYSWPAYAVNLRARLKCPVGLVVVTLDNGVARWAGQTIDLGWETWFTPRVISPAVIPVITNRAQARANPQMAVLSAVAHARGTNATRSAQIASVASFALAKLDADRSRMYLDFMLSALSTDARRRLETMDPAKYKYQSDFARKYVAQGKTQGQADLVAKQLAHRFGALNTSARARIAAASTKELNVIGKRLLTAETLREALGPLKRARAA